MSWASSSPQFPQFLLGVKYQASCFGQKVPPDGELQRRPVEKGYYIWEPGYNDSQEVKALLEKGAIEYVPFDKGTPTLISHTD